MKGLWSSWVEDQSPGFPGPAGGHELLRQRLRARHFKIYREVIAPQRPAINPALAGYFNEFLASTTSSLLRHWSETGLRPSPEIMGAVLHALTGPPTLQRMVDQFGAAF